MKTRNYKDMSSEELKDLRSGLAFLSKNNKNAADAVKDIDKELKRRAKG